MTIPFVSVLIDTYNYSQFIEKAIDSVLEQTYPHDKIEIIVVDDGSTDDTQNKVKKYKDKIRYFYKSNGGQASAFNLGIKEAHGEYIVLLDSDDYCLPTRVERIVKEFEKDDSIGCVLNSRRIINGDTVIHEKYPHFSNLELNWESLENIKKSAYGTSRTSLRKKALSNIFPLPEKGLKIEADLYLNLSILWFCNLSSLNEELTVYNMHGNNLFSVHDIKKLPTHISCMKLALNYIRRTAKTSKKYDEQLSNNLLNPYEIEIKEKEFSLNTSIAFSIN